MENVNSRPSSPLSTSTIAQATTYLPPSTSPPPITQSKRYSEPTTNRQKRLLNNRNAKFPAKKLSLSNIGSKFSQLIHANEEEQEYITDEAQTRFIGTKENTAIDSQRFLGEVATSSRKSRKGGEFSIYQDTPERPLLQRSPYSSPSTYPDQSSELCSPFVFDQVQDSLTNMRLRQISGNELRSSPLLSSQLTGPVKANKKRKSAQLKAGFDTQEYIEHLERELQQAKDDMFSPTTNRSLKDQLRAARHENDKLRQDLTDMRETFEAEVKRTIEHKAQMEVELKRKLRSLEDELQQKVCFIRDLELEYDGRRLDSNTIDTLKATIDKLEQDKVSLSEENRSMSKRNEVLSELLAMSPTKTQFYDLKSPIREKRAAARPMSMIIPRLPPSPTGRQISQPSSAVVSPALSAGTPFFRHWKADVDSLPLGGQGLDVNRIDEIEPDQPDFIVAQGSHAHDNASTCVRSRRSTMQSQISFTDTASLASDSSSPVDQPSQRQYPKRKPRKFMSGSTQLKPLLLPALTNESLPLTSPSIPTSPKSEALHNISQVLIDPSIHSVSQPTEEKAEESTLLSTESAIHNLSDLDSNSTSAVYNTFEEILAAHETTGSIETGSNTDLYVAPPSCLAANNAETCNMNTFESTWVLKPGNEIFKYPSESREMIGHSQVSALSPPSDMLCCKELGHRPLRSNLNLDALNDLNLPEPNFDLIPEQNSSANDALFMAVPQPLFSMHGPINQSSQNIDHSTKFDPQPRLIRQPQPLSHRHPGQSKPHLGYFDLSPTPKSRSSWHGSTVGQLSATQPLRMTHGRNSSRPDLPQRSTLRNPESLTRTKGPLDMIRSGRLGPQPLAALTIKTIFGTISQCTRHIRDFKRNPLALARRLIANFWLSNWKIFGRLSWWVLGLFIQSGVGGPKLKQFDWSTYDAEEIARKACQNVPAARLATTDNRESPADAIRPAQDPVISLPPKKKLGWGQTAMLWGKFSVAIVLAIGGAVVKGPGEMLKETERPASTGSSVKASCVGDSGHEQPPGATENLDGRFTSGDRATRSIHGAQYGRFPVPPEIRKRSNSSRHSISYSVPSLKGFHGGFVEQPGNCINFDEDATLRPTGSPRMPVAALFEREEVGRNQYSWP